MGRNRAIIPNPIKKLKATLKLFDFKNSNIFSLLLRDMFKHFTLLPFLVGILIGTFVLFFFKSEPVTIMKYPHPSNVDSRTYKDKNGVCYRYTSKEVNCDDNEAALKPYPLQ